MKVAEAAKALGWSTNGVMYHIRKGHIKATEVPYKKSPRNLRWDVSAEEIATYKKRKEEQ